MLLSAQLAASILVVIAVAVRYTVTDGDMEGY